MGKAMTGLTVFAVALCAMCRLAAADFNVRDFGAKGDGVAKDTAAIQAAVDAAAGAGGGRVVLPSGTYLSGSVFLKDDVEFHLDEGATLKGSPDREDYNAADVCAQNWASPIDGDNMSGGHLLLCIERKNVAVTGPGTVDGNVTAFFLGEHVDGIWPDGKRQVKWRPGQMVYFIECDRVAIRDVRFRNAPYWTCYVCGCTNVEIDGADVRTMRSPRTYNGDGLDIDCCEHVRIRNCRIRTDDDAIALRCYDDKLKVKRPCRDIRISDCELSSLCNCLRVGVGTGTVEDAVIERIRVVDSRIAINITGTYARGATVGGRFRDIVFRDWSGECWKNFIKVYPGPGADATLDYRLENVLFERIRGTAYLPTEVIGSEGERTKSVRLKDVDIRNSDDGSKMEVVTGPGKVEL